jgi:hypothetical protein
VIPPAHRRAWRATTIVVLVLAGVATACSGSGEDEATTTPRSKTEPSEDALVAWAGQVCGQVSVWNEAMVRVRTATGDLGAADPAAARQQIVAALDGGVGATDALLEQLRALGDAPADDGSDVTVALTRAFESARVTLAKGSTDAAALPTDSVASFDAARSALSAELLTALEQAGADLVDGPNAASLDKAFAAAPLCAAGLET